MSIGKTEASNVSNIVKAACHEATSVTIIQPQPSSHGKVVKLSVIDQIAPRDYISLCLFFKLSPDADTRSIFRVLEMALLNTVDDIPELACCVQKNTSNGREEVQLLFDTSKGVEIHYKDYTSPKLRDLWKFGTFDQLEQDHFPLSKMPRHVVFGTSAKLEENVTLPSLIVQANFVPGGLILGSCLHHVSGDGICNFLWHKTMGAHFATIADRLLNKPTSPIPFLERSRVVEGDQGMTLEEFPDWKLAEDASSFLNPTDYEASEIPTFEYATYFISTEKLALLKSRVSIKVPDIRLSTTDILGAFLWRQVILARKIDPQKYPEAKLSITVDSRGRMENPTVPPNYWGNFAEPNAVAKLPVVSLQKGSPVSSSSTSETAWGTIYPEAARRIHGAIAAVNDKAVRRLVGLLNQMPKATTLTWNVDRYPGPDMLIVCIQAHRFNEIHFGREIGYPLATRCTVGDTEGKPDGRCMILPPRRADGRGLEIMLQYDKITLERLENNIEFKDFFVRRN
ncbi:trichothecene 3-O-acetyltransferase [Ilyonectria robusta]